MMSTTVDDGVPSTAVMDSAQMADAVLRLATSLATEVDFESVLQTCLEQVRASLGADVVHVCGLEDGSTALRLLGQINVPDVVLPRLQRFVITDGFLAARAAATREIQLVSTLDDLDPLAELAREVLTRSGCQSMLSIPLLVAGQLVGVLTYAARAPRRFEAEELGMVRTVASMLAAAIYRAQTHARLTREVTERARAEALLQSRERDLRYVVDGASDGVFLADANGRYTRVNAAGAQMLGYEPEELVGKTIAELIRPMDLPRLEGARMRVLAGAVETEEWVMRCKDGAERVVEVSTRMLPDGRWLALTRDVTARIHAERERESLLRQLQAERAWLRAVIDRSPVGILLVEGTTDPRFMVNRQLEDMLGLPVANMADAAHNASMFQNVDGSPVTHEQRPLVRALRGETVLREEFTLERARSNRLVVRVNAVPIYDDEHTLEGAVMLTDDITAEKDLERLREEWIAVIAHDLRQPIHAVRAHAQLLARQLDPTARTASSVAHILAATNRLARMVTDLLETSRLEARQLTLEPRPMALEPFVRAVVERMVGEAGDHPLRVVRCDEVDTVRADPDRLEQVLGNLISNAAKYGAPGTEIIVEIARDRDGDRDQGQARVSVINQGRGIDPAELPFLFERFRRSEATRRSGAPGLGIGLYIARGLIEAHGGRIWAESEPGAETAFRFTVPIADIP